MKIKFARTLAIASALSVAFAGLTAFAAAAGVTTITDYDYTDTTNKNVTVTTTVTGLQPGTEVAYYVCDETTETDIVYIDQKTFPATAEGNSVVFTFSDTRSDFLRAKAKFGSNEDGATFPTFIFNDGTNYLNQDTAQATKDENNWGVPVSGEKATLLGDLTGVADTALAYKGTVTGAATEYGVKIVTTGAVAGETADTYYFPAYGCGDDGTFVVIIEGYTPQTGDTVVAYALPETVVAE